MTGYTHDYMRNTRQAGIPRGRDFMRRHYYDIREDEGLREEQLGHTRYVRGGKEDGSRIRR